MDVTTTIAQGALRGTLADGVASFKGIPYAAAPFGPNRFGAPVRPERWDGVLDATAYGATAPHGPFRPPVDALIPEPIIRGLDCLNLNVWSPDVGRAGLPVMVWLHGGSFENGSGAVPMYAGHRFARDGVVCVTLNYRLGCDGFLVLDDAPANRGLLDQVAALEWVQENVAAFGGDPSNVTVFGESAGAMSAISLLTMPRAAGLFRRAIAQSGAGHHALTSDTARRAAALLARRLGVVPTRDGVGGVSLDVLLAAQRQLIVDVAEDADGESWRELLLDDMAFEPVVDGTVLPHRPIDAVAQGVGSDVDLLIGTNLDEFLLFAVPEGRIDEVDEDDLAATSATLGLDDAGVATYRDAAGTPGELHAAVMTDWSFRVPAIRLAEAHRGRSHLYEFAWRSPLFAGRLGACHALELPFVFDTLDVHGVGALYEGAPQEVATAMHAAWVAYATTGDPGWPPYDTTTRATMRVGLDAQVVHDPRPEQRGAWAGIR